MIMCDGRRKNIQRLPTLLIVLVGLILTCLACGCVSVRYALAEDGSGGGSFDYAVVYGPNSAAGLSDSDNPRYLVQVYASNKFDAALIALGYNPTSSSFTNDARAYLSNQSTGGAFYDFAQLFSNNNTDWGDEITATPGLTPGINFDVTNMETALKLNNSVYGADNVWSAEYMTSQRIAAVTAVGLVLSGDVGGGGGGGIEVPDNGMLSTIAVLEMTQSGSMYNVGDIYNVTGTTDNGSFTGSVIRNHRLLAGTQGSTSGIYTYEPTTQITYMSNDVQVNYINGWLSDGYDVLIGMKNANKSLTLLAIEHGKWSLIYSGGNIAGVSINQGASYINYLNSQQANTRVWKRDGAYIVQYTQLGDTTVRTYTNEDFSSCFERFYTQIDGGNENPVVPPTNWPDPPENPTVDPPSVPQPPTDDPIQQPTDTPIQPPNVWMPIAGTTDPTFTVDLQGILDAMSAHCQHIRDNLDSNFAQLYNNMTDYWSRKYTNFKQFLDGQFGYIGDTIVDETKELMEYLEDLFDWLAEQFDFSVSGTGYNDNTVVSWLRKIYARLGGGTTIRPPDPVVDPKGIGDWLNQLLQNLVLDLLAIGQDVLADLVESFRELITKFPFSIPWDIAAILALLVAEPQAPVIEIPQYTYTGLAIQQVGMYRLDLSQWNSVMDVVRPMETILFAGWLAFKTDFFKGLLEMTKG